MSIMPLKLKEKRINIPCFHFDDFQKYKNFSHVLWRDARVKFFKKSTIITSIDIYITPTSTTRQTSSHFLQKETDEIDTTMKDRGALDS